MGNKPQVSSAIIIQDISGFSRKKFFLQDIQGFPGAVGTLSYNTLQIAHIIVYKANNI
jgi:hypothetical protein